MQVADSQFAASPTGCTFTLREPLAKPTARRCRSCGEDVWLHHPSEVSDLDLRSVLDAIADSRATTIEHGLLVGGFKAALAEAEALHTVVVVNCAGRKLHDFLPKTRTPFEDLRAQGRVLDLEWDDSDDFCVPTADIATAIAWVGDRAAAGLSVVISCAQGRSRSGFMATALLMHRHRMTSTDALALLRSRRPYCQPNPGFVRQLAILEEVILGMPAPAK
mmetsp:Transcript_6477/g.19196  ORF Transcript_6477/g.19196 Transcript_6477/m.19196 type:complete len:220 (-) Transcript_6477:60-719(-)